jgi:hypothetical protein
MGRDADDYRVRSWAGAVIGVILVALAEWTSSGGEEDFAKLVDKALAHLESGFASGGAS